MDTTQKNREEAARRPRQEAPKSAQRTPQSAKQRPAVGETVQRQPRQESARAAANAAQRGDTAKSRQQRSKQAASDQKQAVAKQRQTVPKQTAPKQTAPKQTAAKRKQTAVQQRPAASKKKQNASQPGLPDSVSTKKRAYGNSKPKKKSTLAVMGDILKSTAQRNAAKKKAKQETKDKKPRTKQRPKQPAPAVIYTQPQAFNRSRFFIQLLTVTAVVVALVMGLSVFFKVETITVSGADVYDAWTVREASGISEGDNLLTFSRARAGALIKAKLSYVKDVRFGIKLPDTVNIIIVEEEVVYAIKDSNGQWWLMNSDGRVVEQTNGAKAANYTQVLGVTLDNPVAGEKGVATESAPAGTDESGEAIPVTVTGAQRLAVSLEILKALEDNDIVGSAASVNVASLEAITLWYGTRYQVNLGDSARLSYKIACMNDVILQMSEYQSGILDISFTIWPNEVGYTPFS